METTPTTRIMASTCSSSSTVMLSLTNYTEWRQHILESLNEGVGYVDGTIQAPEEAQNQQEYQSWKTFDDNIRAWILESVTEEVMRPLAMEGLTTAREVWIALQDILSNSVPSLPQSIHRSSSVPSLPQSIHMSSSAVNYPYPSEVNVANYVPLIFDETNYSLWKKLMLNLITSHQLVGFVDGTIVPPQLPSPEEEQNQEQHRLWMRSDGLVKGWIFATVTEEILLKRVRLNTAGEFEEVLSSSDESGEILPELVSLTTAREVWIALENIPAPSKSESSDEAGFVAVALGDSSFRSRDCSAGGWRLMLQCKSSVGIGVGQDSTISIPDPRPNPHED